MQITDEMMAAEAEVKRAEWLAKNGFNENKETFVYFPNDSYDVKDTLKKDGFHFNQFLLWHIAEVPEQYADKVVSIKLDEVVEMGAWGAGNYLKDARNKVESIIKQARPHKLITSAWQGEIGERLKNISASIVTLRGFQGKYGYSQVVKLESEEGNYFIWYTSTDLSTYEVGDKIILSGTVKGHNNDKYNEDAEITLLTRCRLKVA